MGEQPPRAVLVTGAAGGIGAAIAASFAADGDAVGLIDRDAHRLRAITEQMRQGGARVVPYAADVRDTTAVRAAVEAAAAELGQFNVVCANAGVFIAADTELADVAGDVIDELIGVNLRGTINVLQAAIPLLRDGASITVTSSTSGLQAHPGAAVYAATKTALIGLMRSLAVELAPQKVRVNAVCPGAVDTDMLRLAHTSEQILGFERDNPLNRIATPEEVADAFHFLASPAARQITGVALRVDGGDCLFGAI